MVWLLRHCSPSGKYGFRKNILEIGVAYGYHADFVCTLLPSISYIGVDPYQANYDPNDIFCSDVRKLFGDQDTQNAMNRLFNVVSSNLNKYDGRARLIREKSWVAAEQFQDGMFDLVYIDGDHTYEGVVKDLEAWFPKVRKGGMICGDDIGWPGVKQAVDEFFIKLKKEYQVIAKNGFENMPAFYYIVE